MTDQSNTEREAVRTTIVGGRPPGSGKGLGDIPRGLEVLIKKAAVDAEFRRLLLEKRAEAAGQISLTLTASETLMLNAVPAGQLEGIIARTRVEESALPAFLSKVAAAMLLVLGVTTATSQQVEVAGAKANPPATAPADDGPPMPIGGVMVTPKVRPPASQPASAPTSRPTSMPANISALVAKLDAADFKDRQAAQDELEKLGAAVVPYVELALQDKTLSAEVRHRLSLIMDILKPARPENPPQVGVGARI